MREVELALRLQALADALDEDAACQESDGWKHTLRRHRDEALSIAGELVRK
ncbi:hypothetical protein [Dietzia cercidiphylli]|jgi:hypothetical protein|uniref:hypothetical protein n=1 Tax=Dietzia cercidiphylli TaxID=498199 RepID=UPI00223B1866|nr:hypothetical protein [Dietzia cercidiphylli]MCT1515300.1 hypothetical protein [Dietzia cercidiphylli]